MGEMGGKRVRWRNGRVRYTIVGEETDVVMVEAVPRK